jgi:hypothetical protein
MEGPRMDGRRIQEEETKGSLKDRRTIQEEEDCVMIVKLS